MRTFELSQFNEILPPKSAMVVATKMDESVLSRAKKYATTFDHAIEGGRNQTAYKLAARLREKFILTNPEIFEILCGWNAGNTPPLGEEELRSIVFGADKYAKRPAGSGYEPPKAKGHMTPAPEAQDARQGTSQGIDTIIGDSISGKRNVISLLWTRLAALTIALLSGTITLLCGGIGARKSFVVLQILLDLIRRQIKVAVLWLEEDVPYYQNRALAQLAEMPDLMSPDFVKSNPSLVQDLMNEHRTLVEAVGECSWDFAQSQPTQDDVAVWVETRVKEGYRILIVDPITAASRTAAPWLSDDQFIQRLKRAAVDSGCSLLLVTHSVKSMTSVPDLNMLAGSAAFGRFCQCALWLESHDLKTSSISTSCGTSESQHNSTVHILKTRNGPGTGLRIAMHADSLSLREVGIIIKKKQEKKNDSK
jgi:hypothetical protein